MKTVCSFPGCRTGTNSERVRNKSLGIRNKTLFTFPKTNPQLRKQWEEVIGREAGSNEVICELHFHKEDIQKQYITKLANGMEHRIDRTKPLLNPSAVPHRINPALRDIQSPGITGSFATAFQLSSSISEASEMLPLLSINSTSNFSPSTEDSPPLMLANTNKPDVNVQPSRPLGNIDVNNRQGLTTIRDPPPRTPLSCKLAPSNAIKSTPPLIISNTEDENVVVDEQENQCIHLQRPRKVYQRDPFTLEKLNNQLKDRKLPKGWSHVLLEKFLILAHWTTNTPARKQLHVHADGSVQVHIDGHVTDIPGIKPGTTADNLFDNLKVVQSLLICDGTGISNRYSSTCRRFVNPTKSRIKHGSVRCCMCQKFRKKLGRLEAQRRKIMSREEGKKKEDRRKLKNEKAKNKRLKTRLDKLKAEVARARKKCASADEKIIEQKIAELPKEQQEAVRACFASAKVSNRGRRYTQQWIYECLLMRIKNRGLYEHIRSHGILAVPCVDTLNNYLKRMGSAYGFNQSTFDLLAMKAKEMTPAEKRGTLLLDEMKLAETLKFDRNSFQYEGFVNLGDHTPVNQERSLGDHALVLMFQPFRGQWVQALACFLSKGCANSKVLECLVLECIILLEKSGFHVDVVTTDGASWNRTMWSRFEVKGDNCSCQHPYDSNRKLWFCSDFPHLIKNFRNAIVSRCETWTPDGVIKLKHWRSIINFENHPYAFKIAFKLTEDHLNPRYYQKMNVPMAFQFFSERIATAMQIFKEEDPELADCDPTVNFINRIDPLIEVMMSREPLKALKRDTEAHEIIKDFLDYLIKWEEACKEKNYDFLSGSTCKGLKVTLRATLEILEFLTFEHNYEYLMTARLNQDALERFFSLARGVCGSNDHPDSITFGQMFRLMSTYSLIKPVKGSNVSGGEMLHALLKFNEKDQTPSGRQEWEKIIDSMIEKGESAGLSNLESSHENMDANLNLQGTPRCLLAYMAGYVVRKCRTSCPECLKDIQETQSDKDHHKMISLLNKGRLIYPSDKLLKLLEKMESTVLTVMSEQPFSCDTLFHITYALQELVLPLIGCPEHEKELTKAVMSFYVLTRADFLAKSFNRNTYETHQKTVKSRKDAKL